MPSLIPSVELQQLAVFMSAVECGSLSLAALAHNVSQPTLSTKIRQLEEAIGITLFHRNGRGVVATEAGKRLYERVKPLVGAMDAALIEASAADGMHLGEIVVGVVPTAAGRLMLPLAFENLRVRVVEAFSGHLQEWLEKGDIDIAIGTAVPKRRAIRQTPICSEALFLVGKAHASRPKPTTELRELDGVPLVVGGPSHSIRQILEAVCTRQGVRLHIAYEVDGLDAQLRFVHQGLAYAVLPAAALHEKAKLDSLQLWKIVAPTINRQLVVATRTDRSRGNPAIDQVAQALIRRLQP